MTVRTRAQLDSIARQARREFSYAAMSDTKWRKLLAAIGEADLALTQVVVKFIDVQEPKRMHFPALGLHPPRPWIDTLEFGPIELRSIEWLLIPDVALVRHGAKKVPPREVPQDVDAVERLLGALGQFPLERSAEGLRIIGYRRRVERRDLPVAQAARPSQKRPA
jgi:hypothetical protein